MKNKWIRKLHYNVSGMTYIVNKSKDLKKENGKPLEKL